MIVVYSRSFAGTVPTTDLQLQLDPSDPTKVWQVYTLTNNPCWSVAGADGQVVEVLQSTIPGPTVEKPLSRNASGTAPLWDQSSPALPLPDLLFDGSNDNMILTTRTGTTFAPISNLLGTAGKTFLVAFQVHAASLNSGNPWLNHVIMQDSNEFFGLLVRKSGSGPDVYQLQFYNWDGNADLVEIPITLDTSYVACYRHDGTNLFGSINGGSESSVASGTTTNGGGAMRVGGFPTDRFFNGSIGEMLCYNVALTGGALTDAVSYMTDKWL